MPSTVEGVLNALECQNINLLMFEIKDTLRWHFIFIDWEH